MEDQEIIHRIHNGSDKDFELLVKKYHRNLLNFIYRLVGNPETVEDIGQEVFISAYRALHRFDTKRGIPFGAWLFAIARNRCISELRKKSLVSFIPLYEEITASGKSDHYSQEEHVLQKERLKAVSQALDQLNPQYKEAILQSLRGASMEEVAQACDIPINTAKTRLFRAREKLRTLIHLFNQE